MNYLEYEDLSMILQVMHGDRQRMMNTSESFPTSTTKKMMDKTIKRIEDEMSLARDRNRNYPLQDRVIQIMRDMSDDLIGGSGARCAARIIEEVTTNEAKTPR